MSTELEKKKMATDLEVPGDGPPSLPQSIQGELGKQLRKAYCDLLAEPLPDKFNDLLKRLANGDGTSK